MDSLKTDSLGPFIILHNHRRPPSNFQRHTEHKRHHKDYSTLPHSIIMTRKMMAEQENKEKQLQRSQQIESCANLKDFPEREGSMGDPDFFCENDLERGIPVQDLEAEEAALNHMEVSQGSNYTKLEKTLFGIGYVGMDDDGWDGRL